MSKALRKTLILFIKPVLLGNVQVKRPIVELDASGQGCEIIAAVAESEEGEKTLLWGPPDVHMRERKCNGQGKKQQTVGMKL